jgi:hypothetical protein
MTLRLARRYAALGRRSLPLVFCRLSCYDGIEPHQSGRRAARHNACQLAQDHLTYFVPYVVSTYGAVSVQIRQAVSAGTIGSVDAP